MNPDVKNDADESFFSGDLANATTQYCNLMKCWKADGISEEKNDLLWTNDYFQKRLTECDEKLKLYPKMAACYLEKAAIFFFMEEWEKARDVLATGLSNCSDKSNIRATLGNLNKLERFFSSADKTNSHQN